MPSEQPVLPELVRRVLDELVLAATAALGANLTAVVLYGSGAEGKLRKTSDVNVILVMKAFVPEQVDALREPLRTAHAAIALEAMFILEREIAAAVEAFAVKFSDIRHRHHVLFGKDPFIDVAPSRAAEIARLKQVLLNLVLRLRQRYLLRSLRDEQAAPVIADSAGPIRACAEALLELEGVHVASPKEALAKVCARLPGAPWSEVLGRLSEARETGTLPPGVGPVTLLRLVQLVTEMYRSLEKAEALEEVP